MAIFSLLRRFGSHTGRVLRGGQDKVQTGSGSLDTTLEHVQTVAQLAEFLKDHGYAQFVRSDAASWVEVLDWRIERTNAGWRVGYFERGQPTETLVDSDNEGAAVQNFLKTVSSEIYHLQTFNDAGGISRLETALRAADLPYQRNDVPFENLLRIFVAGRHLRRAQQIAAALAA